MTKTALMTTWSVDTHQGHEIEVVHRDILVSSDAEAARVESRIGAMTLSSDGSLIAVVGERQIAVPERDVTISVYTRPMNQRGRPFILDTSTPKGRDQIMATFTDPAYIATAEDYEVVQMTLVELAALPGAVGSMGALAYGTRALK
jgi:hypothetical protein